MQNDNKNNNIDEINKKNDNDSVASKLDNLSNEEKEELIKKRKKKYLKNDILKDIRDFVICTLICFILAAFINNFILINANIPTGSMNNTIPTKARVFGNRLAYNEKNKPEYGDIVIFWAPDEPGVLYVKRLIGKGGDTIEIVDGSLYRNGEIIEESYIAEPMNGSFGPYEVPNGSYFVMGDNRNHSNDARFWKSTHFITDDDIVAKAVFMYFPSFKVLE